MTIHICIADILVIEVSQFNDLSCIDVNSPRNIIICLEGNVNLNKCSRQKSSRRQEAV
jgi:hypothetical protein